MASGKSSPVVAGRILERLARYRFLTVPQLLSAGAGDEKTVRIRLRELVTAELAGAQEFRLGRGGGTLDTLYWLTGDGAARLASGGGPLPSFPKNPVLTVPQYWHRRLTVDALIAADTWAHVTGQELPEFRTYMQFKGKKVASAIPALNIKGDVILQAFGADDVRRTYVVEVYCSHYSAGRSSFPADQLEAYAKAGQSDALDDALGISESEPQARLLVVCDTAALRDRLLRTLPSRHGLPDAAGGVWRRFHFKCADELADFGNGWHQVTGDAVTLPSGSPEGL